MPRRPAELMPRLGATHLLVDRTPCRCRNRTPHERPRRQLCVPRLGRSDITPYRRCAELAEFCCGCVRSRQAQQFVPARSQLPHHRGADRTCPTEYEYSHRSFLCGSSPTGATAGVALQEYCGARAWPQKCLKRNPPRRNFASIYFRLASPCNVRFSPALDVLPFCGLFHLTRPSSSRERSINNRRSQQAA